GLSARDERRGPSAARSPPAGAAMIWLSWRQLRASASATYEALAVVAVVVAISGSQLHSAYTASGIAGCTGDSCDSVIQAFVGRDPFLQTLLDKILLLLLPALTGIFWA